MRGNLLIIQYLLYNGWEPQIKDIDGNTPFHVACSNDHLPVVKYFIDNNYVDKNIKGFKERTLLHYACYEGYLPIIEYLIHKGLTSDPKI